MKKAVGLWIDNERAVIFSLADEGAELRRILPRPNAGIVSTGGKKEIANETAETERAGRLSDYFREVISHIRNSESILIFGPGEAKTEIKKRLEDLDLHSRIVGFETMSRMTDNEIVAKVRQRFLK